MSIGRRELEVETTIVYEHLNDAFGRNFKAKDKVRYKLDDELLVYEIKAILPEGVVLESEKETITVPDDKVVNYFRYVVEQGGTRSGKTWNILIWILWDYCTKNTGKEIGICRKTLAACKKSVMKDWDDILREAGLYNPNKINKSDNIYHIFGNTIQFFGLDKDSKAKGVKRDLLYANEASELDYMDYFQLNMRTADSIILDYNPDEDFWIFDKVLTRDDAIMYITTYKHNPFLPDMLVKEIERLKDADEELWQVYGLGQLGMGRNKVYRYNVITKIPEGAKFLGYGLDWGYSNDYTAVVKMYLHKRRVYIDEVIYQLELSNREIAKLIKASGYKGTMPVYCDSADPKSIDELMGYGIMAIGVKKGKGSVKQGIMLLRQFGALNITAGSVNVIKELKKYRYVTDRNGDVTNTPIDAFNHALDACRYVGLEVLSNSGYGEYAVG